MPSYYNPWKGRHVETGDARKEFQENKVSLLIRILEALGLKKKNDQAVYDRKVKNGQLKGWD